MRKIVCILLIITMLLMFVACSPYISSYSALGLMRSSYGNKCEARFHSLGGRLVFNLRASGDGGDEGDIRYTASLDEGSITVYYDIWGEKELLFTLSGGESIESHGGYIEEGKQVYIIIEAEGAKGGSVKIELDA